MAEKTIAQLAADVVEAIDAVASCDELEKEASRAESRARNDLTTARNRLRAARASLDEAIDKSIGKG